MSLTPSSALVLGLGSRIVFNVLFKPVEAGLSSSIGDFVVQGLWQGALLFYVYTEHESFAPALAVGLASRLLLDFASSGDQLKLAYTVGSALLGLFASFALTQILNDDFSFSDEIIESRPTHDVMRERSDRRSDRGSVRRVGERISRRIPRRRERIRVDKTVPFREPSPARQDVSYANTNINTMTITDGSSETVELYTGLGRLVDMQLSSLRKLAASAEANRRRCKEERKWAMAQGNRALATQLKWQIRRYAALYESYTREADRRIIEAAKHDAAGTTNMNSAVPHADVQPQQPPAQNYDEFMMHDRYPYHLPPPAAPPQQQQYARLDKGKGPMHQWIRNMNDPLASAYGWEQHHQL